MTIFRIYYFNAYIYMYKWAYKERKKKTVDKDMTILFWLLWSVLTVTPNLPVEQGLLNHTCISKVVLNCSVLTTASDMYV